MTKRTKIGQLKHDRSVLDQTKYYNRLGYKVRADLPSFKKPVSVGGRIPDIEAKKGNERVIVEVETKDSIKNDESQIKTFKKYAGTHKNTRFRVKIAK